MIVPCLPPCSVVNRFLWWVIPFTRACSTQVSASDAGRVVAAPAHEEGQQGRVKAEQGERSERAAPAVFLLRYSSFYSASTLHGGTFVTVDMMMVAYLVPEQAVLNSHFLHRVSQWRKIVMYTVESSRYRCDLTIIAVFYAFPLRPQKNGTYTTN